MRGTRRPLRLAAWCVALAMSGGLVACGSDDDERGSGATGKPAAAGTAEAVKAAEEAVAKGYAGTDRELPKDGPKAVPGKNIWVIASTLEGEGAARPAREAAAAAKELGWEAKVADGKLDPNEQANQIRNAIAAKADAIIVVSFSCDAMPGAFQEARDAGVKTYGVFTRDCAQEPLLDGKIQYGDGVTDLAVEVVEPQIANWVIAKTEGKGEIIQLFFDDGGALRDGAENFASSIEANCPECELRRVPITGEDIGKGRIQAKTAAALNQYPNADVVWSVVDGIILLGAGAAVGEANAQGRNVLLTGLEGLTPNLEMIAAGGPQSLAAGSPGAWHGWAAVDGLNRIFAGEPEVDAGIGYQLIDKANPPPSVPYDGNERSLGWKDNYRRIWGVG